MRRFIFLIILVLLPVLACTQERIITPVVIEWNGNSSFHEIAVQMGTEEIIILGETDLLEYSIDLQTLGYYGLYAVLVRGVEYTNQDMVDRSDWIRSDNPDDVIIINGEPFMFLLESKKDAEKPTMIRIGE